MPKQKKIWVIVIFLVPVLACSIFGSSEGGDAALDADLSAATATQAAGEETVVEDVETVKKEEEEETQTEPETSEFTGVTGLDDMSAYRVNFVMEFDGQSGGQPSKGRIEMVLEVTKDPPARHLAMNMEGTTVEQTGGTNAIDLYTIGDTVHMKNAAMGDAWVSFSGGEAESFEQGFFAPDEDLELPKTAACDSQPEVVNDISAIHCSFTEKDVLGEQATYDSLQGDVWLAVDGNYIVKYTLKAQGYRSVKDEEGVFDFGDVGFEYDLTDPNGDFTITLPPEAESGDDLDLGGGVGGDVDTGDMPVLEDAEEVMSMAGFTNYYTGAAITEVVDFYRQKLPAMGWTENADQAYTDESNALLNFEKDGQTLMLTVTLEEGRTSVIITTIDQ
jgi:hypothetical protein